MGKLKKHKDISTVDFAPNAIDDNWDGEVEVSPVRDDGKNAEVCKPGEENYWSVYLHQKTGGVKCIADLPTQELANVFATMVKKFYWLAAKTV